MFDFIKSIRTRETPIQDSKPQSNVLPSIKINGTPAKMTASRTVKASQTKERHTDSKEIPKRLKLKDYMRLNEISKQKRSRSAQCLKLESKQKLSKSNNFDIHQTFGVKRVGYGSEIQADKKQQTPYSQEAALQRFQLANTVNKIKDKFTNLIKLIEETSYQFTTYNDLVFMFRVEEILNDYIKKGIHTIATAYKDHFIAYPHQGMDVQMINLKTSHIVTMKKQNSPQTSPIKTEKKNLQDLIAKQDQKFSNLNIMPISFSLKECNSKRLEAQKTLTSILKIHPNLCD